MRVVISHEEIQKVLSEKLEETLGRTIDPKDVVLGWENGATAVYELTPAKKSE